MSKKSLPPRVPVSAGSLMDEHIAFQFGIYYLPRPNKDPLEELNSLLKESNFFTQVQTLQGDETAPSLAVRVDSTPNVTYPPPGLESLRYFGRGLKKEEGEALQASEEVLILEFGYSKDHVWSGMRAALELTNSLARNTDGLIWDDTTREIFSATAWEKQRITSWTETSPDMSKQTVIHAYKKDDYVRAITLGMAKFGLPDIVIENFSWSLNSNMGILITLFSQAVAEGAVIDKPGIFDLDIKNIKNSQVREPQVLSLKSNATGVAHLTLKEGVFEDGDPTNRLIEIMFDRGTGPDIHAKQEQIVSATFGWEDSVVQIKHDESLKNASRAARSKLPALQAHFDTGLAPGELIQVKAPFSKPAGGQEWMWVEVTTWKGGKIAGLLKNEPFNIPSLHAGQMVEVSEADVFDYIHKHPNGTVEGNETGKLIEKQSKK